MPTFNDQTGDPVEQLVAIISDLRSRVSALEGRSLRVPNLDADPTSGDPTNLWLLEDGRLRSRTVDGLLHEYPDIASLRPPIPTFASDPASSTGWRLWFNGSTGELRGRLANGQVVRYAPVSAASSSDGGTGTAGSGTSTKAKPADTPPKRYTKTYSATWARAFCPTHGVETGGDLEYGTFPGGSHGKRRVMIGFDDAQIRSDLNGATIRDVQLRMVNTHSWWNGGVDVHFGAHNKSAAPAAYSAVRRNVAIRHFPKSGTGDPEWKGVPSWYGKAFRDGNARGLTIDPPTSSTTHYGAFSWASVRLRITYTR